MKIQIGKVSTKHRAGFYEYEPRYLEVVCKSMRGVKNEGKMSGTNFNKYDQIQICVTGFMNRSICRCESGEERCSEKSVKNFLL